MNSEAHEIVSVVIATLGGSSLHETIKRLNSGTIIPTEIIVCIPREHAARVQGFTYDNVKVLETAIKGQVAQRALGFREALGDYILQIDDDVLIDGRCLEYLVRTLKTNGRKAVAGAAIYETVSDKPVYNKIKKGVVLQRIYYWLLNGKDGYKQGVVDRAGVNIGVNYLTVNEDEVSVEWLAGGCVAHYKENLILENFYPFEGKAYSEDLIHSYLLSSAGNKLIVNVNAKCYIDILCADKMSFKEYWNIFRFDYRARLYYVKLTEKSLLRMHVYYLTWFMSYCFKHFFR
ncbi:MAG: glycosyltransferase involved in cell wall biosynthesis [Enterobacterales bacterium]|jgi:glycosyltransferase involved in cell wall biosynthesis